MENPVNTGSLCLFLRWHRRSYSIDDSADTKWMRVKIANLNNKMTSAVLIAIHKSPE